MGVVGSFVANVPVVGFVAGIVVGGIVAGVVACGVVGGVDCVASFVDCVASVVDCVAGVVDCVAGVVWLKVGGNSVPINHKMKLDIIWECMSNFPFTTPKLVLCEVTN